jgi:hypothetical protein
VVLRRENPVTIASSSGRLSKLPVGENHLFPYKEWNGAAASLTTAMRVPTNQKQVGGTTARVTDCYLWAEIYYLDSPTDYRECLRSDYPLSEVPSNDLVMIDNVTPGPRAGAGRLLAATFSACIILLAIVFVLRF